MQFTILILLCMAAYSCQEVKSSNNGQTIQTAKILCDHHFDLPFGEDEKNCDIQQCYPGRFRCNNNKCIPNIHWCNHQNDCGDNSDEQWCAYRQCSSQSEAACSNGQCINIKSVCDGYQDCFDGDDEQYCGLKTCSYGNFSCHFHRCVDKQKQCQNIHDCMDSNGLNCVNPKSCNKYFTAPSGSIRSIGYPKTYQNRNTCRYTISVDPKYFIIITFEDIEIASCDACGCESLLIKDVKCSTSKTVNMRRYCGKSIPSPYISCGNVVELTLLTNATYRQQSKYYGFSLKYKAIEQATTCPSQHFNCSYGQCIQSNKVCDGKYDCPDWSDELNCGSTSNCNLVFNQSSGSIQIRGNQSYPSHCWQYNIKITLPVHHTTELEFKSVDFDQIGRKCQNTIDLFLPTIAKTYSICDFKLHNRFINIGPITYLTIYIRNRYHFIVNIKYKAGSAWSLFGSNLYNFMFIYYQQSYATAEEQCLQYQAHLVSIKNQEENQYLASILFRPIWLGIHISSFSLDQNDYPGFRWFPDNVNNVNYTNWAKESESQVSGPITLENGKWRAKNFTDRLGYICKKELVCNRTIIDDSGIITSPNYPHNYSVNLNCIYHFPARPNKTIILKFDLIELDISDASCLGDRIYLYQNQVDYVAGPICSSTAVGIPFQSNSSLNVRFHSNGLYTGVGFTAKYYYVETCHKTLSGQGNINISSIDTSIPTNRSCIYQLMATKSNETIVLSINKFLSSRSSGQCATSDDYIEIFDGKEATLDNLIIRICQQIDDQGLNYTIASSMSIMTVVVVRKWNPSNTDRSFHLQSSFKSSPILAPTEVDNSCVGQSIQLLANGSNSEYVVTIKSKSKTAFSELFFDSLTLSTVENQSNQIYLNRKYANYLEITSQRQSKTVLIAKLYHNSPQIDKIIVNNSDITTVRLIVKSIHDNRASIGFSGHCIANTKLASSQGKLINTVIQPDANLLSTLYYPKNYQPIRTYTYSIQTASTANQIPFIALSAQDHPSRYLEGIGCVHALNIYFSSTTDRVPAFHFCQKTPNMTIISPENIIKLELVPSSILLKNQIRFQLQYSSYEDRCNSTWSSLEETLTTPRFPAGIQYNRPCWFQIQLKSATQVYFRITTTISKTNVNLNQYLNLTNTTHRLDLASQLPHSASVISISSRFFISVNMKELKFGETITISYKEITQFTPIHVKKSTTFESPNFPNGYPSDGIYVYSLQTTSSLNHIYMSFSTISLPLPVGNPEQCYDYVEIRDHRQSLAHLCQPNLITSIASRGDRLQVIFVTQKRKKPSTYPGFKATAISVQQPDLQKGTAGICNVSNQLANFGSQSDTVGWNPITPTFFNSQCRFTILRQPEDSGTLQAQLTVDPEFSSNVLACSSTITIHDGNDKLITAYPDHYCLLNQELPKSLSTTNSGLSFQISFGSVAYQAIHKRKKLFSLKISYIKSEEFWSGSKYRCSFEIPCLWQVDNIDGHRWWRILSAKNASDKVIGAAEIGLLNRDHTKGRDGQGHYLVLNPLNQFTPATNASISTTVTIPGSSQVHVGFWLFHGSNFPIRICLTYSILGVTQPVNSTKYCLQFKLIADWSFVQFPILNIPKLSKGIAGINLNIRVWQEKPTDSLAIDDIIVCLNCNLNNTDCPKQANMQAKVYDSNGQIYFQSPWYPFFSPYTMQCTTLLSIPKQINSFYIRLKLVDYTTNRPLIQCAINYLQMKIDTNTRINLCPNDYPDQIIAINTKTPMQILNSFYEKNIEVKYKFHLENFLAQPQQKEQIIRLKKVTDVIEFTSPNYPLPYPLISDFTYKLTIDPGHRIQIDIQDLKFDHFHLPLDDDCTEDNDYLEVRDGALSTSELIGKLCKDVKIVMVATSNWLWVKFHSNRLRYSKVEKGFKAVASRFNRQASCSRVYTTSKGSLEIDLTKNCTYSIRSQDDGVIALNIQIDGLALLNSSELTDLKSHKIDIKDAIKAFSPTLSTIDLSLMPFSLEASSNQVDMQYITKSSTLLQKSSLALSVNVSWITVGKIIASALGQVTQFNPDRNISYWHTESAKNYWITKGSGQFRSIYRFQLANKPTTISLKSPYISSTTNGLCMILWYKFPIESSINLQIKYTTINDSKPILVWLSTHPVDNQWRVQTIPIALTKVVQIELIISSGGYGTSLNTVDIGYMEIRNSLCTHPVHYSLGSSCHQKVTSDSSSSFFQSPTFDSSIKTVASDNFCTYQLQGRDRFLKLIFINFNIGDRNSKDCAENYLEIRVGDSSQGTLLGRYCGQKSPSMEITPGSTLYLLYKWNATGIQVGNNTRKFGFRAYIVDSNTQLGIKSGNCDFTETALKRTMILPIPSTLTYKLATYCFIINHRQGVGIHFTYNMFHLGVNIGNQDQVVCSKAAIQLDSLKNFQDGLVSNSQCGIYTSNTFQRLINGINATIAMLNFQYNPYGVFDHQYVVNITYQMQFDKNIGCIPGEYRCSDGLCLPMLAFPDTYRCNSVIDCIDESDEYNCVTNSSGCNFNYNSNHGIIQSFGYPSRYHIGTECLYHIQLKDPNSRVVLTFKRFYLRPSINCKEDYLVVRDGNTLAARRIYQGVYCGSAIPPVMISSSSSLLIQLRISSSASLLELPKNGGGFLAFYQSLSYYTPCPKDSFQCQNGECVDATERCNGEFACSDHSDEHLCGNKTALQSCWPSEFQCSNGQCENKYQVCKYSSHYCQDNSHWSFCGRNASKCDEIYHAKSDKISSYRFPQLPSNQSQCIYTIQPSGNISEITLQFNRFYLPNSRYDCQQNYLTISTEYERLDTTRRYCGSQSPEKMTFVGNVLYLKLVVTNHFNQGGGFSLFYRINSNLSTCNENQFQCYDGSCIQLASTCDNINNCLDHSDEIFCPNVTACWSNDFKCNDGQCVQNDYKCNNGYKCKDNSQQIACGQSACPVCRWTKCRKWETLCNHVIDCQDGSDELHCANITCPNACICNSTSLDCRNRKLQILPSPLNVDLTAIYLSHNQFETLPAQPFSKLSDVGFLDLSHNHLFHDGSSNEFLKGLIRLYALDLSYNNMTIIPQHFLQNVKRLRSLYIQGNYVQEIESGAFSECAELRILNLSNQQLSTIHRSFSQCFNLTVLNLAQNSLKNISAIAFDGLMNLELLDLSYNWIEFIESGSFQDLAQLKTLLLQNNQLKSISSDVFFGMNSLSELTISNNPFDLGLIAENTFQYLTHLHYLRSSSTYFCCLKPGIKQCYPALDVLSSCQDMLADKVLKVMVWVMGVFAILCNLVVLLYRWNVKIEQKSVPSFLILNLAFADFMMGVYLISIGIADRYMQGRYAKEEKTWLHSPYCKICGIISSISSEMSVFTLLNMTIDRYLWIVYPFSINKLGIRKAKFIMFCAWPTTLLIFLAPAFSQLMPYFSGFYSSSSVCLPFSLSPARNTAWLYTLCLFIFCNTVIFIIILTLYLNMFIVIKRTNQAVQSTDALNQRRIMIQMMLIVFTDLACWLPAIVLAILTFFGVNIGARTFSYYAVLGLPINSAINPILYTATTKSFKERLMRSWASSRRTSATKSQVYSTSSASNTTINSTRRTIRNFTPTVPLEAMKKTADKPPIVNIRKCGQLKEGQFLIMAAWLNWKSDKVFGMLKSFSNKERNMWANEARILRLLSKESGKPEGIVKFLWLSSYSELRYTCSPGENVNDILLQLVICTELIYGEMLCKVMKTNSQSLSIGNLYDITLDILEALVYIHQKNIAINLLEDDSILYGSRTPKGPKTAILYNFTLATNVDNGTQVEKDIQLFGHLILKLLKKQDEPDSNCIGIDNVGLVHDDGQCSDNDYEKKLHMLSICEEIIRPPSDEEFIKSYNSTEVLAMMKNWIRNF